LDVNDYQLEARFPTNLGNQIPELGVGLTGRSPKELIGAE
jgi:hypothetical protein